MEKELFLDAAVCMDGDLYFTAMNSHCLYKRSKETGTISAVAAMATSSTRTKKFASMFVHKEKIWMIPWNETHIWVYDIVTDKMKYFDLPNDVTKSDKGAFFRRTIAVGSDIWAVPNWAECIMRIDMEKECFELYSDWPEGVIVSFNTPNFKSVSYNADEELLYLLRDGCNENLVLDVNTGTMRILKLPACGEFGCIKGDRIVIAPVKTGNRIRVFRRENDQTMTLECEFELPDHIWEEEELYAYWYVDYIEDKWIILPNRANALLVVDNRGLKLDVIKLPIDAYRESGIKEPFAGYEAIQMENEIWILPYEGNQILILDEENRIVDCIRLKVSSECEKNELDGLFAEVFGDVKAEWNNNKCEYEKINTTNSSDTIGTKIYNALK